MNNSTLSQDQWIQRLFYSLLIFHLIAWTLLPVFIRYTVTHDAIEAFVWAQHLSFGYDKNPYLVGWLTHLSLLFDYHQSAIGYYFLQQLFVILGFWSIFQLGKKLFNIIYAFLGTLSLEGCLYFSVYVKINNDNFFLIGLWMLAAYTFYLAIEHQKIRHWILTACALGFAMMSKYNTAIFLVGFFAYLVFDEKARRSFFKPGLYIAALIGFLISLPNLIWLFNHQWIAFQYITMRQHFVSHFSFWHQHFHYPLSFLGAILSNFTLPIVLLLFTLPFHFKRKETDRNDAALKYLFWVGFFPLLLTVVLAAFLKWHLYWEWGVPFLPLWGLLLVGILKPSIHPKAILRFTIATLFIMILALTLNGLISGKLKAGKGSADYPARMIANYAEKVWYQHYKTPLKYVAGSRYTAGYVSFYSKDHPKVFAEWNNLYSPGVADQMVRKNGAIFIQDGYYGTEVLSKPKGYKDASHFPASILKRYPNLIILPLKTFQYHRNHKTHETVNVLIGILPP